MPEEVLYKATQLVEYLSALVKLNARTVLSTDEHEKVFWLHDLPSSSRYCFNRVCEAKDARRTQEDDVWIAIRRSRAPKLPRPPERCLLWLQQTALENFRAIPELKASAELGGSKLLLKNFPAVLEEWRCYVEQQWKPWAEECRRYEAIQQACEELFFFHQEMQKTGERNELALGLGLLRWKNRSGREIKRHVAVIGVSLTFDPGQGQFVVRQDGDRAGIELDMLDEQPPNARELFEEGRLAVSAAALDRSSLDNLLRKIVNSLSPAVQGEYFLDRLAPRIDSDWTIPTIEHAPALILRRRSQRGLEQLLAAMKKFISAGTMSDSFREFCEISSGKEARTEMQVASVDEVYFPLPANDEQRRIVRMLDSQMGVIVQGPPGTGKTHTIANLICHLLAKGQRVLVTAKTARALQALQDKLPEDVRPLCVSLMGEASESSLAQSAAGILARVDSWDKDDSSSKIQRLEAKIQELRQDKAVTDRKIWALREQEIAVHNLAGGRYSGTAAQIAQQLRLDAERHAEWFVDSIPFNVPVPLSAKGISFLREWLEDASPIEEQQLKLLLPALERIPPVQLMEEAFKKEALAVEKAAPGEHRLQDGQGAFLLSAGRTDRARILSLLRHVEELAAVVRSLRQRPMPWIDRAVQDVLSGQTRVWQELLKLSRESISGLVGLVAGVNAISIAIPQGVDRKKLLQDAAVLHNHFSSGGKSRRWIFKSELVRRHGSMVGRVTADGQDCSNPEALEKLLAWLTVESRLDRAWSLWEGMAERSTGHFSFQFIELEELQKTLEGTLGLAGRQEKIKAVAAAVGLELPQWTNGVALRELANDCRAVLAQLDCMRIKSSIRQFENYFVELAETGKAHPLSAQLAASIAERNIEAYARLHEEAISLANKMKKMRTVRQLLAELGRMAPVLAAQLGSCRQPEIWVRRMEQIDDAWAWAQTSSWLNEFLQQTDVEGLLRRSSSQQEEIFSNLGRLTAEKAWKSCLERMDAAQQQHLMAWQLAMRKLGKAVGKDAPVHRRNAWNHLSRCRAAAPAWIMPLHQVYESINSEAGQFDVVIVDEASQCGPEAIPLLYLGKRLIAVGDDRQVSPHAVGIDQDRVRQLMRTWLDGFELADSFGLDSSLFDHCRMRFKNRISLREHFRCMPEIIRFSSSLCYQKSQLLPLRQPPPDRLPPLRSFFVGNGQREGHGQNAINRQEAEALASAVARCCQDERYQGLTMGVIVLQGTAQADLIQELLIRRIGTEEIKRRRIVCGAAPSFQGGERDVVFLSMVIAPNARIAALTGTKYEQRFNVAASRARDQLWLFHSVTLGHLSPECLRRKLLEHFLQPQAAAGTVAASSSELELLRLSVRRADRKVENPPSPFASWFEVDVALRIVAEGYRIVMPHEVAGIRIDLLVQGDKAVLAVRCDGGGWHDSDHHAAELERQRQLERCGWQFLRIRESLYYADPDKALKPFRDRLAHMGIGTVRDKNFPTGVSVEAT